MAGTTHDKWLPEPVWDGGVASIVGPRTVAAVRENARDGRREAVLLPLGS
jgi:hypothetical protein